MTEDFSRRPIASRNTKWAAYVTRQLVARQVAPNHISIASVVQRERSTGGAVPIVIRTHGTRERDLRRALDRVAKMPSVSGKPVAIRIEENPG